MTVGSKEISDAKKFTVLDYLMRADPNELVKTSREEYQLRSHDSFKISNGMWYWFSRQIGGRTAIDYLIKVKNYAFPEAVREVNRVMKGRDPSLFDAQKSHRKTRKELVLPIKSDSDEIVYDYLISRGLDSTLITKMLAQGLIYQNAVHNSVVFVGLNNEGKPAHASYRSTLDNAKGDYRGSDKRFAFRFDNPDSDVVRVFESAIDLMSYATICIKLGCKYDDTALISTAGISAGGYDESFKLPLALEQYMMDHPNVNEIILMLDHDEAGIRTSERIMNKLNGQYHVRIQYPPEGKDYNEYLMYVINKEDETNE